MKLNMKFDIYQVGSFV